MSQSIYPVAPQTPGGPQAPAGGGQGIQGMMPWAFGNSALAGNLIQRMQPGGYGGGYQPPPWAGGGVPSGQWGMPGSSMAPPPGMSRQADIGRGWLSPFQARGPQGPFQTQAAWANDMMSNRGPQSPEQMQEQQRYQEMLRLQNERQIEAMRQQQQPQPGNSSPWTSPQGGFNPWIKQYMSAMQSPVSVPATPTDSKPSTGSGPVVPDATSTRVPTPPPLTPPGPNAPKGRPTQADIDRVMNGTGNISDLVGQTGAAVGKTSNPTPSTPPNPNIVPPPGAPTPASVKAQIPGVLNSNDPNGPNITDLVRQVSQYQPGMGLGIARPPTPPQMPYQPNFGMSQYGSYGGYGGFNPFGMNPWAQYAR